MAAVMMPSGTIAASGMLGWLRDQLSPRSRMYT